MAGLHYGHAYLLKLTVFINLKHATTFLRQIKNFLKDFIWLEANEKQTGNIYPGIQANKVYSAALCEAFAQLRIFQNMSFTFYLPQTGFGAI
jgi:hypothetical protein